MTKLDKFIKKAKLIHGDKYDYSKVKYINAHSKIIIICHKHGEFEQTPDNHNRNHGCGKCNGGIKQSGINFIEKAKIKHGEKYDYSKVDYVNNHTKVNIICPNHGIFKQRPNDHLNGNGCKKCGVNIRVNKRTLSTNEFVNMASNKHGVYYDYSKVDYVNNHTKVNIICPIHGNFKQRPNDHLKGNGCPRCRESRGEREIRKYLIDNKIKFIPQKRFDDCKDIRPLPFDFYLPDCNICIEYDGEQHFKPIKTFGGEVGFKKTKKRDKIKTKYCDGLNNRPTLHRIPYYDLNLKNLKGLILCK